MASIPGAALGGRRRFACGPTLVCLPPPPRSEMWPKAVYISFVSNHESSAARLPYNYPAIPRPRPQRSSTAYPTRTCLPCSSRMHKTARRPKVDICRLTLQPAYPVDSSHVCSSHGPSHASSATRLPCKHSHVLPSLHTGRLPTLQPAYPAGSLRIPADPPPHAYPAGGLPCRHSHVCSSTRDGLPCRLLHAAHASRAQARICRPTLQAPRPGVRTRQPPCLGVSPAYPADPAYPAVPDLPAASWLACGAPYPAAPTLQPARRTAAGCHCSRWFQWYSGPRGHTLQRTHHHEAAARRPRPDLPTYPTHVP